MISLTSFGKAGVGWSYEEILRMPDEERSWYSGEIYKIAKAAEKK